MGKIEEYKNDNNEYDKLKQLNDEYKQKINVLIEEKIEITNEMNELNEKLDVLTTQNNELTKQNIQNELTLQLNENGKLLDNVSRLESELEGAMKENKELLNKYNNECDEYDNKLDVLTKQNHELN
eukprot:438833_1